MSKKVDFYLELCEKQQLDVVNIKADL